MLNDTSNFKFNPPAEKPDLTMDFDVSFSKELANELDAVPSNLINSIEKTNKMINVYK